MSIHQHITRIWTFWIGTGPIQIPLCELFYRAELSGKHNKTELSVPFYLHLLEMMECNLIFLIVPIFICIIFALIMRVFSKFGSSTQEMLEGFTVKPPSYVIPEEYRRSSYSDGSDFRTVRLPNHYPNCGSALTHKDVDWVGLMEAKCNYREGTVRASFEKL